MSIEALAAPLSRVDLFRDLSPVQLAGLARIAERVTFRPGETITRSGEEGDAAVLIVSGDAVCLDDEDDDRAPEPIEPGSLIGEMAMLIDHVYGTTVVAAGPVRALRLPRTDVLAQVEADPVLGEHFLACISSRLKVVAAELRRIDRSLEAPIVRATIVPRRGVPGAEQPAQAAPAGS